MSFTDDDLKRLKEDNPSVRPHPDGSCRDSRSGIFCRQCELAMSDQAKDVNALLARLEAAERYISSTWGKFPVDIDAADAWNEWRKAAGK